LQIVAYLLVAAAAGALLRPSRRATIVVCAILGAMWAVNALGYHLLFFSEINPLAPAFAALFLLQAIGLAAYPIFYPDQRFRLAGGIRPMVAIALMMLRPLSIRCGAWQRRSAIHMPIFGLAPCPTTII